MVGGLSGYMVGRSAMLRCTSLLTLKEVLAMYVTTDDIHDSEVLPSMMADASRHRLISEACMDGAYDSGKSYRLLRSMVESQ